MPVACLVDTTRCIGCRSCQVACKESKGLGTDPPRSPPVPGGYRRSQRFSPNTFTYVSYYELDDPGGSPRWVFVKRQCLHCTDLYCAAVCPMGVFYRDDSGVVRYDGDQCVGCGACLDSCPFQVPSIDYGERVTPRARKCTFCISRQEAEVADLELNGHRLEGPALQRYQESLRSPACAKACPAGAIRFGHREALIQEARRRIAAEPDRYVGHIYGLTEAGGTSWLYLAGVPFEELGFPTRFVNIDMFRVGDFGQLDRGRRSLARDRLQEAPAQRGCHHLVNRNGWPA